MARSIWPEKKACRAAASWSPFLASLLKSRCSDPPRQPSAHSQAQTTPNRCALGCAGEGGRTGRTPCPTPPPTLPHTH